MAAYTTYFPVLADVASYEGPFYYEPDGPDGDSYGYARGPWDKYFGQRSYGLWWKLYPFQVDDNSPNVQSDSYVIPASPTPFRWNLTSWVSPRLKAQTLGGTIDLVMAVAQTSLDCQFGWRIIVWVSKGRYFLPERGLALDYTEPPGRPFPIVSSGWGLPSPQTLAPIAIQDGDYLTIEVGVIAYAHPGASRTASIVYAASTGRLPAGTAQPLLSVGGTSVFDHAGSVRFSQPLALLDPPTNDACATPIVIPALPYTSPTPVLAELATYDPTTDLRATCGSSDSGLYNSVWWQWTAPSTGTVRLEAVTTTDDYALTAYTGSCGALTQVACVMNYMRPAVIVLPVTAGTVYHFRVGGRFNLSATQASITARYVTVPGNDNFANATVLTSLPFSEVSDTTAATAEPGEPVSADGWTSTPTCSVWYKWVADATPGNIRINTFGSDYDSQITIWAGTAWGALTEVYSCPWWNYVDPARGGIDYGFSDQANCVFSPTPGQTYYFTIFSGEIGGHLELSITRETDIPHNQSAATAIDIGAVPHYHIYSFVNAADGPMSIVPLGDCDWFTMADNDSGKELWFKWTAARSAPMNFNTYGAPGGGPYPEVIIYTGTPSALVPLLCDGLNMHNWQTQLFFDAVAGTTYYWRIDSQARMEGPLYFYLDEDTDTFQCGDLIVGADWVYLFRSNGAFVRLVDAHADVPTASGTDPNTGLLYQALFVGNYIMRMNGRLDELGTFSTEPGLTPEVPGFFMDGRLFVGHWGDRSTWGPVPPAPETDPTFAIRQFDPDTGALIAVHIAEQELTGTAWVDPSADQRTLVYNSYGRRMLRFDIVSGTQQLDFALLPGAWPTYQARGLRQRPNGEYLVADRIEVKRISADGLTVLQTYQVHGTGTGPDNSTTGFNDDLNVLDQDETGDSFWVGDQDSTDVHRVNVVTGAVFTLPGGPFGLYGWHNGAGQLCGLSVVDGYRAGTVGPVTPAPPELGCAEPLPVDPDDL